MPLPLHKKYGVKGNPGLPCKTNHIVLSKANSFEHEMTKSLLALIHYKGGDMRIIWPQIAPAWKKFLKEASPFLKKWLHHGDRNFITEAEDKFSGKVRDLVIAESGEEIEVCYKNNTVGVKKDYERDGVTVIEL